MKSLCSSCQYSILRENERGDIKIRCHQFDEIIIRPILRCTSYKDRDKTSLWQLQQIAWVLRSDNRKGPMGFVPLKEMSKEERKKFYVDDPLEE